MAASSFVLKRDFSCFITKIIEHLGLKAQKFDSRVKSVIKSPAGCIGGENDEGRGVTLE